MSKICAVVGVGPGIGLAVAKRFAREGYTLALLARRRDALEESARQVGKDAHPFIADAYHSDSLIHAFTQIRMQLGSPEVLIYNVAAMQPGRPSMLDSSRLMAEFTVNVAGALVCAQQVVPQMVEAGKGTVLFTGGGLATNPTVEYASLAIGKAGLRSLAYTMGAELEPLGVHVATVTIQGYIKAGTHFDPKKIAEKYWQLHTQPKGQFAREIVYKRERRTHEA